MKTTTKFKCVVCGNVSSGRMPRRGDSTGRFPRRHKIDGKLCPGNFRLALWVDINDHKN